MGIFLDIHSYGQLMIWPWGFTFTMPPNGTQLQTLGRKLAYFNDYDPSQAIYLYPTDGTTDDFAYGDLGLASYTYELGTTFYQDCSTFENTILPENTPSLIYAAKASRTPYITPAGPDALNVTVSPNMVAVGDLVTLEATINDTRYNNQNGTEPTQNIAAAAYYIDTPPSITGTITNTMSAAEGGFNNSIEDVTATIDTSGFSPGRHIIYVRGQDANGNWGVVSAAYLYINETQFNINKATSAVVAHPEDVFTYTLSADLVMTGTNSYSLMLTDTLPSDVSVLPNSIRVDGVSAPNLYITETHAVVYLASGTFTDTYDVEITLQVDVGSEVIPWTLITNQLDGQASINGELILPPETEEVTTLVLSSSEENFHLPIIIK
jgi:hypothetical protein